MAVAETADELGIDFIKSLHVRHYRWKNEAKGHEGVFHGLVAQEVETALAGVEFAGLVKPEKNGGVYGLRYSEFIAPLIKGEQDLADQISVLQETVRALTVELSSLKGQGHATIH